MLTKEIIVKKLTEVIDPELNIDIVNLGLIREINIGEYYEELNQHEYVNVLITLTSPMCPFADFIIQDIENKIMEITKSDIVVDITFDPPWTCPEELRLELGVN
jgi:metal-sulfur cluster biosynthetic enzyme